MTWRAEPLGTERVVDASRNDHAHGSMANAVSGQLSTASQASASMPSGTSSTRSTQWPSSSLSNRAGASE